MRQARKRVSQSAEKERPTQMYASFTMRWKLAVGGRRMNWSSWGSHMYLRGNPFGSSTSLYDHYRSALVLRSYLGFFCALYWLMQHSMTRLILASLVLTTSILPLYAQSSTLHTDQSGYTTGIDGNRTVNTYTDRYGNTTGWVGGKYMSTYSDGYGGSMGTIGNKRVTTYEDSYGNTTGTVGRDRINLYTDRSGTTTGKIGRRRLNCYTDSFGTTTCN